mmetsp:Transcript_16321/g.23011  ORF Transcript_16321/g.23011 Transcript_16321/m.23011 type:complete len:420 (-) Transcript_16321:18-1277(-)
MAKALDMIKQLNENFKDKDEDALCPMCFKKNEFSQSVYCTAGHKFCLDCLLVEIEPRRREFIHFPRCPIFDCNAIFHAFFLDKMNLLNDVINQPSFDPFSSGLLKIEANTSILECECCYCEANLEDLVSCNEGHIFCQDCLKRYIEEQLFGLNKFEILCMSSEGCKAQFRDQFIKKVLTDEAYRAFQTNFASKEALIALGESLVKCHKCDFKAEICGTNNLFQCPQIDCGAKTCSKCKEEFHKGTCEENQKLTNKRLTIEEAMTQAFVRTCPKCKASFVKNAGCNLMTCSCGTYMCYACKKVIPEKYSHFCQTPHCNHLQCNKCQIFKDYTAAIKREVERAKTFAAKDFESKNDIPMPLMKTTQTHSNQIYFTPVSSLPISQPGQQLNHITNRNLNENSNHHTKRKKIRRFLGWLFKKF